MKRIKMIICAVLTGVFISGCSGLKFRDADINLGLPDDWKYRTPIKNTADLRFFMRENVGLLVTPGAVPGTYEVLAQPILPDSFTPREEIIKDGAIYSSKITQSASVQGGYLAVAASLSADQALDFRVVDLSRVDVPWTQFPDAKIRAAAAIANPRNIKRLWVQSLILSRILSQSYSKLECDATGAGPAFQAGGKCFNTTGVEARDYAIGVVFVDIDKYVKNNPGNAANPATKNVLDKLHLLMGSVDRIEKEKSAPTLPSFISVEAPYAEIKGILTKHK